MSTTVKFLVNCDTQDEPYGETGVNWVEVDLSDDKIIYSKGSEGIVADGLLIPSEIQLTYAGSIISESSPVTVPKYFLKDKDAGILREIPNAGNKNKKYVFCFYFDGATTSEPRLELWDDINLDTLNLFSLGNGTPAHTWWRGVVTTDDLPSDDWPGVPLAGDSIGKFLWLNNGGGGSPLTAEKALYINLKIIILKGASQGGSDAPVFAIKWTGN